MLKIILSGCNGKMGKAVSALAEASADAHIVAGIDINLQPGSPYPVFQSIAEYAGEADVVVDFSHFSSLHALLAYCTERSLPLVLATTGYDSAAEASIAAAAKKIPVFKSANMSLGISLLADLVKKACRVLGSTFDIEIIEKHHNQKLDAPSGTALMLADAASQSLPHDTRYMYDRHAVHQKRDRAEIGIHSVRGGTIVGEHEVIFAGYNEIVTLSHSAASREVFAAGALKAAGYIAGIAAPGLYSMDSLVASL